MTLKKYTGIEIGTSQLKMVAVNANRIQQVALEPLPDNYVKDGRVVSMEAMSEFIKAAAKKHRITCKNAALVLPDALAFTRRLTIPPMTAEQLKINLPFEFHDFINDTKDKYVFDYSVLELKKDEDGKPVSMDLMACTASKDHVEEYRSMLKRAGFILRTAMPEVFAYSNLIRVFEKSGGFNKVRNGRSKTDARPASAAGSAKNVKSTDNARSLSGADVTDAMQGEAAADNPDSPKTVNGEWKMPDVREGTDTGDGNNTGSSNTGNSSTGNSNTGGGFAGGKTGTGSTGTGNTGTGSAGNSSAGTGFPQDTGSLQNADAEHEYCFIDIGYHNTKLHIFSGMRFEVTRVIETGTEALIHEIAGAMNVDEHLAREYLLQNYEDAWSLEACRNIYEGVAVEAMRAVNFYGFNNPSSHLDTVYYCGGGSMIDPFTEAIDSHINLKRKPVTELYADGEDTPEDAALYPAAIGVAYL